MQSTSEVEFGWWVGNNRLAEISGKWLAAHIAQYALIVFWTGAITLFEVSRYNPDLPMGEQGLILIPHLAAFGIGVGSGGVVTDISTIAAVGWVHLVATAVYGFGAFFHSQLGPATLSDGDLGRTSNFDFTWDDPEKLGFILGHHLLFLGAAALLFVAWIRFHGIYDPTVGEVVAVSNPGATIVSVIFEYGWFTPGHNPYFVDNLADIASGHAFIGVIEVFGGIWHITQAPYGWAQKLLGSLYSSEGQLASALAGLSVLGFAAAYYTAVNTFAYPVEFFGPALDAKLGVAPYFVDTVELPAGSFTGRAWLCNVHFYLAFFLLQGHLWHGLKAVGFDFGRIPEAIGSSFAS